MRSITAVALLMFAVTLVFAQRISTPVVTFDQKPHNRPLHDIEGFVYDQEGHPIADVVVMVKNMTTGTEHRVNARLDGSYRFDNLKTADTYEVSAALPQFEPFDAKGITIGWKLATHLDIVLRSN